MTSDKVKVLVAGASGKMGAEILAILKMHPCLVAQVEVGNTPTGQTPHYAASFESVKEKEVDVVIDFSSPALFRQSLGWCKAHKRPLISGTTGISVADHALIDEAAKTIPVLWAPNMSLGIAVLNRALSLMNTIAGWDFQIEEIHHNQKKDKPSGTALLLQNTLSKSIGKELPAIHATRGGGIFGEHTVLAMSQEEMLTFKHQALNRAVFARGAILAAGWIAKKSAGKYSIEDVVRGA